MEKKNLQPQQQKPVVRPTVAKPTTIAGLSEEQLTAGWSGASGAIAPSQSYNGWGPFAGDDAD